MILRLQKLRPIKISVQDQLLPPSALLFITVHGTLSGFLLYDTYHKLPLF